MTGTHLHALVAHLAAAMQALGMPQECIDAATDIATKKRLELAPAAEGVDS